MRAKLCILLSVLFVSACSPDFLRVHYSRINSAQSAGQRLVLTADAPGAFVQNWNFNSGNGFRFDPADIQINRGFAQLTAGAPGRPQIAALELSHGYPFVALFEFTEVTGPKHQGQVRYQISPDQSRWYFHDQTRWKLAIYNSQNANTAEELNRQLKSFHQEIGGGQLFVRAFLIAPRGKESVELQQIQVRGIAPKTDGWN